MATNKKTIPRTFLTWCRSHFKDDTDKIDIPSEYDLSLTIAENMTIFRNKFSIYFKEEPKFSREEAVKKHKESMLTDNINKLQERLGVQIAFVE